MKKIIITEVIVLVLGVICSFINDADLVSVMNNILVLIPFCVFVDVASDYVLKYNMSHDKKLTIAPMYVAFVMWIISFINCVEEQIPYGIAYCAFLISFVAYVYTTVRTINTLKKPQWLILLAFIPIVRLFVLNSIFKTIDNENKNV